MCCTRPNSDSPVLTTGQDVATVIVNCCNSATMCFPDLPDLSLLVDSVEAAQESISVAYEYCVVIFSVEDACGAHVSFLGIASKKRLVFRKVPRFQGTVYVDTCESIAVSAEANVRNAARVRIRMQQVAQVVGEDSVHFTALCSNDQFLPVVRKVY